VTGIIEFKGDPPFELTLRQGATATFSRGNVKVTLPVSSGGCAHAGTEDRSGATLTSGLPACPAPAGIVGSRLSGTPEKNFLTKIPRTMAPSPSSGVALGERQ
jgi:hypothetical protein